MQNPSKEPSGTNLLAVEVDPSKCRRCGACLETCPVSALSEGPEGRPVLSDETACVSCGHCEAVCPSGAFRHARLTASRPIRRDLLREIVPENLSEYLRARRSVRRYLPRSVEREKLLDILGVVAHSPTGINLQRNKWVVVDGASAVRHVADATIAWMRGMVEGETDLAAHLGFARLVEAYDRGDDVICRGAPCLAIGHTDASHTGGSLDSLVATAHLELLLPASGLGGCWAGYVMIAMGLSPEVRETAGLDGSQAVRSALMIGYPKHRMVGIPPRLPPQVAWV